MAKVAARRGGPNRPDISFDAVLPELRKRAVDRQSEIMECLGLEPRSNPDHSLITVIVAAWSYQRFEALYESAPTRSFLRSRLTTLRKVVGTVRKILGSGDGYLLAALSLSGVLEEEALSLDFGSGSKLQAILSELESAADQALALPWLTGPASAHKAWAEGPKTALAIRCARIFEKYQPGKVTRTESKSGGFRRSSVSCTRSRREKWTRLWTGLSGTPSPQSVIIATLSRRAILLSTHSIRWKNFGAI
jgi:hypothetical protein